MRRFPMLAVALLAVATVVPARAQQQVAALTPADREVVAKVEQSLNAIRTLRSHFVQVASSGGVAEGELYLSRPGNLRINYTPPTKMQLVVQGGQLIQVDLKLGTLTFIPLSRTPASILVKEDIKLDRDVSVTGVARGNGLVRLGMVQPGKEDEGSLTMTFNESDMALKQWSVVDAQGIETRVTLTDPQVNGSLDPKVFEFDRSKFEENRL